MEIAIIAIVLGLIVSAFVFSIVKSANRRRAESGTTPTSDSSTGATHLTTHSRLGPDGHITPTSSTEADRATHHTTHSGPGHYGHTTSTSPHLVTHHTAEEPEHDEKLRLDIVEAYDQAISVLIQLMDRTQFLIERYQAMSEDIPQFATFKAEYEHNQSTYQNNLESHTKELERYSNSDFRVKPQIRVILIPTIQSHITSYTQQIAKIKPALDWFGYKESETSPSPATDTLTQSI